MKRTSFIRFREFRRKTSWITRLRIHFRVGSRWSRTYVGLGYDHAGRNRSQVRRGQAPFSLMDNQSESFKRS